MVTLTVEVFMALMCINVAFWLTVCPLISDRMLVPQVVSLKGKKGKEGKVKCIDVFCGSYFTFAVTKEGHIYGFGLANYHQLG